ncbi:UDP-N-acetylglucosamine 1-carboxyvinyltransferase [Candidatus Marinarcus aquaticus]|uniref:UDP-N-acetylglucosamine 1-carboxyvinyltransferase n=1 Tax=Candidatus Marinarcus aquaticus TaxID=2044504 RepID=A0A4Q0XNU8_9BACT|nr:UDP-N-acetylglucosamine 1-carboxyvinyltransferase [Candidatus Marinarcus aquaticus]RXJ55232.1 UDP-N-acetylglucosamine 1-carboxyvinyltransferase [Candidatus Marinarcus aquaticus]
MKYLQILGQKKLAGEVSISGAKNAALPLLASTILAKNSVEICNLPNVVDINTLLKLLEMLGSSFSKIDNNCITINTLNINETKATYDIVKTMRASILVLGPLLARFGHCEVSLPGGCAIGQRPVDLHLKALEQMGAIIEIKAGYILATAPKGLKGSTIVFDKITVTGTENIIMAAALAHGTTKIINAAKEPEVVQLCEVLRDAGLNIKGIGTNEIEIEGTAQELLEFKDFGIIADRIEAGTYLCAGAIANSKITLNNVIPMHLDAVLSKLEEMGFGIEKTDTTITLLPAKSIKPVKLTTTEYPGFPTDMQAQFMALATQANGVSIIDENLFENRYMHVNELLRMGADITLKGHTATITGTPNALTGTDVMATDLRASSALVLAALVAKGTTNIHRIYHLDRGYENLEEKLTALGADVKRFNE